MKRITFLLTFLCFSIILPAKTIISPDSIVSSEKARFLHEDLTRFLGKNIKYPREGLMENKQGDVVLSFIVRENGKIDSLTIETSTDIVLATSSIAAFDLTINDWSPAKTNNLPVDKKYLAVFRYRIYRNSEYVNYKAKAEKYFDKQKFDRALKGFNRAIKDNKYDFELFELRSKTKEKLGDIHGARIDNLNSIILKGKIISIVNVIGLSYTTSGVRQFRIVHRRIDY